MRQTHGYTLEQRDDVAWLWLDRPDLHNAFDDALIAALTVELEELAKLPPNMRAKQICDRRRPPIYVELAVDGKTIYTVEQPPSGLAGSGPSRIYERLLLPIGNHSVTVRMRDNPATDGFDFVETRQIDLKAEQSFVIDFRTASGFTFH